MPRRIAELLLFPLLAGAVGVAGARTSDRNQPMDAESNQNSCTMGDAGRCVLTGNVRITQGSLDIHATKAVIYRNGGDISRAVLDGSPATLKQAMDDGTPMNASANNVDYDLKRELVVFTGNVQITNPSGNLQGERVVYNLKTGNIDGGGEGAGRVKMRILPKTGKPAVPAKAAGQAETAPATPDAEKDQD